MHYLLTSASLISGKCQAFKNLSLFDCNTWVWKNRSWTDVDSSHIELFTSRRPINVMFIYNWRSTTGALARAEQKLLDQFPPPLNKNHKTSRIPKLLLRLPEEWCLLFKKQHVEFNSSLDRKQSHLSWV